VIWMNEQTRKAIAYSMDFLTFIFLEKHIKDKIFSVYLFGSSVRGELDKESDIDIFINCKKDDEDLIEKTAQLAYVTFKKSKDFEKWKYLDFIFPISIKTGPIKEWQLKRSIESEGIQLFSKSVLSEDLERFVLFLIELPKKKSDYLELTRMLFGRKEKEFEKNGLIEKSLGEKIGSNVFIIPKSSQQDIINILHKNKIVFKMHEFFKLKE